MTDSMTTLFELHFCRPIPRYQGKYLASSQGSIFSNTTGKTKYMRVLKSTTGYMVLNICKKRQYVHRLVAETWLQNPKNLPIVNHKDGNKLNNSAENLEYVSCRENNLHARNSLGIQPYQRPVCQITLDGVLIREFKSIGEAGKITKTPLSSISSVCKGKSRKTGEYSWCYKEDFKGLPVRKQANCKSVIQYDSSGHILKIFASANDAAEEIGCSASGISMACTGKVQTFKGFIWKYEAKTKKVEIKDETEEWLILDDYPRYKVSKDGRIYSIHCKKMNKLSDVSGYKFVHIINKFGKGKKVPIHRLVALAYIPNPEDHPVVNHKDGNPSNNTVENLEWCSHSHNIQHAYDMGLNKAKKAVLKISRDGRILERYNSMKEAAISIGISTDSISAVCRGGRNKTAGGFYWKYAHASDVVKN